MKKVGKNIFWGIFLLCSAAVIIASSMGYFAGVGLFSIVLTVLLAAVIIQSLVHLEFFGIMIPVAILTIIYAKPLGLEAITPWPVLIAAVFASIGLDLLFRWKKRPKWHPDHWHGEYREKFQEKVESLEDNVVYNKVSFGAETKYLHSENLEKAEFICSFGSLKIFLDQAKLNPNGAEFYVDCSFGSIILYIPRNWIVKDRVSVNLGAVDFKNQVIDPQGPVLELTGNCQLGSIEIHYI